MRHLVTLQLNEFVPGLAGVPAAESAISYIDGNIGILEYRGHRIETLAEKSNFEEVCWLLVHGALPSKKELAAFRARLARERNLPPRLLDAIRALPAEGHPMGALQASLALLGMFQNRPSLADRAQREEASARLIAATPVLIAAFHRARTNQPLVAPDPALDTAANFLWMLTGRKPDELSARVLDVALLLHADHSMNASTFAARVVASTEADPYTMCASAVGALFGPLHGGANEEVLAQLTEIGSPENVKPWLERELAGKARIMGFGHRVYKTKDPRAKLLQDLTKKLFAKHGSTPLYDVAVTLEKEVVAKLGHKGVYPNVDFFSGIVYQKLGIPTDLFTPVFAISRVAGYVAHWMEQMPHNKLYRPAQIFTGGHDAEYVEIDRR
jgi:citrate synthase